MPLESATRISELVETNPTSGDAMSSGDDHIRLIKATLRSLLSATTFSSPDPYPAGLSQLGFPASLAGKAGQPMVVDPTETKFVLQSLTNSGTLKSIQVFTSSGTWNKPSGITRIHIVCIGGGGRGGIGTSTPGGGGGAGARAEKILDVTAIASEVVTVGAGGSPNGGASSFGAHCIAGGGQGGGDFGVPGAGGSTGTGDVVMPGATGGSGSSTQGGAGGGQGGGLPSSAAFGNFGGGSGGGLSTASSGAPGQVIIYQYGV